MKKYRVRQIRPDRFNLERRFLLVFWKRHDWSSNPSYMLTECKRLEDARNFKARVITEDSPVARGDDNERS